MTLTLQLENVTWFEDGRPTSITLRAEGCRIGRNATMDWVLPDPEGHISRHHCDVVYDGMTYYLVDRSTNGTFLDGQRHRIQGDHPLRDGDRFRVGQYFVSVSLHAPREAAQGAGAPVPEAAPSPPSALPPLVSPQAQPGQAPQARPEPRPEPREVPPTRPVFSDWGVSTSPGPVPEGWGGEGANASGVPGGLQLPPAYGARTGGGSDPWEEESEDLEPVDPLPAPSRRGHAFDAASQDFAPLQRPSPAPDASGLQMPPAAPHPWDEPSAAPGVGGPVPAPAAQENWPDGAPHGPARQPPAPPAPAPPPVARPEEGWPDGAGPVPSAEAGSGGGPVPLPRPSPIDMLPLEEDEDRRVQVQPRRAPATPAGPYAGTAPDGQAFLRAFCEGAGLPPSAFEDVDAAQLARALGRSVRVSTEELMAMLADREAAKRFTGGVEITSWSPRGNNPMKVLADADQALVVMFLRPKNGFMTGPDGFENALQDVHLHQRAVFAALQPALSRVVEGLSPDEIEEDSASGLLGGPSKSRAWDRFVERWTEKSEAGRNGILDCFLKAFSEAYAQAVGGPRD